jgi:hypothetical protein
LAAQAQDAPPKVVHVVVALCDNASQGIVPVPKAIGNGDDPKNNLYWGAMYGVKTFFSRSDVWQKAKNATVPHEAILSREVFVSSTKPTVVIVADAWQGKTLKKATEHYLAYLRREGREEVRFNLKDVETKVAAGGASEVVAYVGHNGLMDFTLPVKTGKEKGPQSIVLACKSRDYFMPHITAAQAQPLLLTTNFMAPEAYTLEAAIRAWAKDPKPAQIAEAAAQAYHRYQKCGIKGARRMFGAKL